MHRTHGCTYDLTGKQIKTQRKGNFRLRKLHCNHSIDFDVLFFNRNKTRAHI